MSAVAIAAIAIIPAACGSSAKTAEPTATTAPAAAAATTTAAGKAAPAGEPIKVMTVTTLNAAGPTYKNIANTAQAYEKYINARAVSPAIR